MNINEPAWVILPLKSRHLAKQRLRAVLTRKEREALYKNMLDDVLEALDNADEIAGVIVVTNDRYAIERAKFFNARSFEVVTEMGLSADVSAAAEYLSEEGVKKIAVLPGDVPLVTSEEIDSLCRSLDNKPGISIVSDRSNTGTNCIICSPPNAISFSFGRNSFERHKRTARANEIPVNIVQCDGLSLDIDTIEDIQELMRHNISSKTQRYLLDSGIVNRMPEDALTDTSGNRQHTSRKLFHIGVC